MRLIWNWLKDDKNRDIIKMIAAGLAALVAATWAVLIFVVDHHPSATVRSGVGGVTAGHDISGNVILLAPPVSTVTPATSPAEKRP